MRNIFFIYALTLHSIISFTQEINSSNSFLNTEEQDSIKMTSNIEKLSKWRHGPSLSIGYSALTDDLKAHFRNFINYELSWTFEYNKIMALGLGINYGISKTKQDILFGERKWENKTKAYFYSGELFAGINVFETHSFRILPFIGVSSLSMMSKSLDPQPLFIVKEGEVVYDYEEERMELEKGVAFIGIMLDIKIRKHKFKPSEYASIRLKYSCYMTNFEKKYDMFNGNIQSLTIGISGLYGL